MKLQESMTGFYYVGTKRANITKLVNIYKRGYASGNLSEAMAELMRKDHIQPEVICFESGYGFETIDQWADLLSSNERLSKIPLIIDADKMTTLENYHFMRNKTVDDILNLQEWDENDLQVKIRFLQKFKTRTRELEKMPKEEKITELPRSMQALLKRSLDFLISFAALIFLTPLFIIIALAIRIESRGNIFYVSKRAGMGYRIFNFYKFRTMSPDADKHRD